MPPEPSSPISEIHARVRRVRGLGVPLLRATWRATLQDGEWAAFREGLSPAAQAFLDTPPERMDWVEVDLLVEAAEAYQRIKPLGLSRLQGALAAEAFEKAEASAFPTPDQLLDQTPFLWRQNFEGGLALVTHREARAAEISIWAILPFDPWLAEFFPEWYRRVLEASGSKQVDVRYLPPEEGSYLHRYALRW